MSSLRALLALGGIVTVAVSMNGCTAQNGSPGADSRQGKIVFNSERGGNFDIYLMNTDGSNQQRLTTWERGDQFPAWSPEGSRIGFTSWGREDGLRAAIFTMDADGSNVTRLSKGIGKQDAPRFLADRATEASWSPDGKRILFHSDDMKGNAGDIFVMDADGSNVRRLTTTPGTGNFSHNPAWSPDGNWIVFDSNRNGNDEIYVMSADGSNVKQLTNTPGTAANRASSQPDWSPDGKRIAFNSTGDRSSDDWQEVIELYTMDADGSDVRRLTYTTDNGESSWDPRWSPDGKRIAFASGSGAKIRDGGDKSRHQQWMDSREIYVMDADGSNVQRLTFNDVFDGHASWQPTRR